MISNLPGPRGTALLPKQIMRKAFPGFLAFLLIVLYLSIASPIEEFNKKDVGFQVTQSTGLIPRKIWQTWKVDPLNFEERDLFTARTWTQKNPGYRYEVLTDQNDVLYVETHFGPKGVNRPDIVYIYKTLTAKIIKADLLRYLVMYVEGGVYTDIDVEALKPMERFIPDRYDEADIDMIIGIEVDEPALHDHPILGQKSQSFCQWTFVCKPRLPVMMRLINNILHWLNGIAERQHRSIADIELDFDEVISGTGPSAFTGAVLAEIGNKVGYEVTWDTFHNLHESKLVGGVLVLTVEAFAAGQGHSDSGNHNARSALVKHHYHASGWPTNHPRYNHPMYGEVERCNWNKDCVHEWDANIAAFDALPAEEQARQIAIKHAMEASAAEMEAAEQPPLEAPAFFPAEVPVEMPGDLPPPPS